MVAHSQVRPPPPPPPLTGVWAGPGGWGGGCDRGVRLSPPSGQVGAGRGGGRVRRRGRSHPSPHTVCVGGRVWPRLSASGLLLPPPFGPRGVRHPALWWVAPHGDIHSIALAPFRVWLVVWEWPALRLPRAGDGSLRALCPPPSRVLAPSPGRGVVDLWLRPTGEGPTPWAPVSRGLSPISVSPLAIFPPPLPEEEPVVGSVVFLRRACYLPHSVMTRTTAGLRPCAPRWLRYRKCSPCHSESPFFASVIKLGFRGLFHLPP